MGFWRVVFTIILPPLGVLLGVAEAVALCRELSTDESPAFLNGLLSTLAQEAERD